MFLRLNVFAEFCEVVVGPSMLNKATTTKF